MADAKVSELTAASSAAASDLLYIVDSTTSKKITIEDLFGGVSTPTAFEDVIAVQDSEDQTVNIATINSTTNVTYIDGWASNSNVQIQAGVDGQIKIIIMKSNAAGVTINVTGSRHIGTTAFSAVGHSATFIYNSTASKWYFIGGSATVS